MELEHQPTRWEGYVDWRNRPALRGLHGGMLAASYVLGVEILENLAYLANASNLVIYLSEYMHLSPSKSANNVTNFMGTSFLLALLGGFLADTFFTTYHIFLISAAIEFLGLVILTVQARSSSLKPPACNASNPTVPCQQIDGAKAAMLFTGLYLVALGVGGVKGSLPAHGAEQFDESTPQGRKQRSTFFNYFVFCLSCGALIAVTFVVWVEDNKGWVWGFGISTIAILLSIPVFLAGSAAYRNKIPSGSPLATISKVLVAAGVNTCMSRSSGNAIASLTTSPSNPNPTSKDATDNSIAVMPVETLTKSLDWLNKAVVNKPIHSALECTVQQVEEVKIVIKIFPIFACTIMLNCCLAQLSTFSVQQADTMDTKLGSLKVPPASLPVFPVVFIMMLAPVYDHLIIPFARKLTKSEMGITHLQRIGTGLVLSIIAMAVAALVEIKRKRVAANSGLADKLPITFFWVAFQYLFLGSADLFTLAGLLEFFFTEAPAGMRSLAMSLSWASLAMGYYLSSVIVSIVNNVTGNSKNRPWLAGTNINHYHLERFYWLLCVLSVLNFLHYLFWATRYKYSTRVKN
ncbi:protein NRT1/ PTR FAMILY 4.6-like [Populus alba x Populus x berolinensis]|uniref:Protein NRT1/ PTR FAMILY 4.6-like n=1 Tax=Populus alba x Populus x berolinensis TaxID=444605 RepID=A0AAD6M8V5_9ROSI|nr:protein NRT1/ PTR FAMILY 4.6-like [Populus alba x Populus x berolinensis]